MNILQKIGTLQCIIQTLGLGTRVNLRPFWSISSSITFAFTSNLFNAWVHWSTTILVASRMGITPNWLSLKAFKQDSLDCCTWTCFCGNMIRKNVNGFTNLATHVRSQHPHFVEAMNCLEETGAISSNSHGTALCWTPKTLRVHAWLEMTFSLFSFSFCEN